MPGDTVFPAFIRATFEDSSQGFPAFERAAASSANRVRQQFEQSSAELTRTLSGALSRGLTGAGAIDLGLTAFRQTAAEARAYEQTLRTTQRTAAALAASTGDTSAATRTYLTALNAQVVEAGRARAEAEAQVTTYTRLQAALDATAAKNSRVAESYRELYAEQARGAQQEVYARNYQAGINEAFSPGLTGQTKSARESAAVFEQAAAQADRYAAAAATVRASIDPMFVAQQRFDAEMATARTAISAGAISLDEYCQKLRLERSLMEGAATARANGVSSYRQMRFASLQLGQQMTDSVVQWQAGTSALTIFTQQVPQAAFALAGLGGRVGAIARFMSGPWGAAIFAAAAVFGPFIVKMFDFGNEVDAATEKLKEQAHETEVNRKAHDIYKTTIEGVTAAIYDQKDALDKLDEAKQTAAARANIEAKNNLDHIRQLRDETDALLAKARASMQAAMQPGPGGEFAIPGATSGMVSSEIQRIERMQTENQAKLEIAEQNYQRSRVNLGIEQAQAKAKSLATEQGRVNSQYDQQLRTLEDTYRTQMGLTTEAKKQIELTNQLAAAQAKVEQARARDLKAISDREAAQRRQERLEERTMLLPLPVEGRISSGFGARTPPTAGASSYHPAIDIAARAGTPVKAGAPGVVVYAGRMGGLGNVVIVDYGNGTIAEFGHLSQTIAKAGQSIHAGETVGLVGSTGTSTGNHVDYRVRTGARVENGRVVGGRYVDPRTARVKLPDPGEAQANYEDAAAAAADRLAQAQAQALNIVQQISREYDRQPKLIDRATASTNALSAIIEHYSQYQDEASMKLVAAAVKAQALAQNAVPAAFDEYVQQQEQSLQIQTLTSQGRTAEADALRDIFTLEDRLGPLTAERKQAVLEIAQARELEARAAEVQRQKTQVYLNALGDVQQTVRDTIASIRTDGLESIPNFVDKLRGTYDNLIADYVTERVFGPAFRAMQDRLEGRTPLDEANDKLATSVHTAGGSAMDLAKALEAATAKINRIVAANDNAAAEGALSGKLDSLGAKMVEKFGFSAQGKAGSASLLEGLADKISAKSGRYNPSPNELMGDALVSLLRSVGVKIDPTSAKQIGGFVGAAFEGAAIGQTAGGLVLGKRGAGKEAQIGGAIGGLAGKATGLPGADIAGSIIGGILGGLLAKPKYGTAAVTSADAAAQLTGSNSSTARDAGSLAGSVSSGLQRIADQLNGTLGDFSLAIGTFDGKYRVNTTATNKSLNYNNFNNSTLYDFGDDQEAAIRFAIMDALKDGAIAGIREGTKRLLESGQDLDRALDKALSFEQVFRDLRQHTDPVGAALDQVNQKFENLKKVFAEAGASAQEYADLEKLYGYERADAIKEAGDKMTSTLKGLLSDLTVGDNGRSLRDRLAAAHAAYDPLAADLAAGKSVDYDQFADAARTMLDIQRQLSGSQIDYFALLDQVTALTQQALNSQQALIDGATGATVNFGTAGAASNDNVTPVVGAIGSQTDALVDAIRQEVGTQLSAVNTNLGSVITLLAANGGGGGNVRFPDFVGRQNF